MERYKVDFTKQTLTLSAAFAAKANDTKSEEYALVCQFKRDFPTLRIVHKTHATPKRYKNCDGSITERNKRRGLTYKRMEQYICAVSPKDDTDYLEAFYEVKAKAKAMCVSPYDAVSKWFVAQFPLYRTNPLFYLENQPEIIDFSAVLDRAAKKPSVAKAEGDEKSA